MLSSGFNGIMNYENVAINLENIDSELSSLCDHEQETKSGIASCSQTGILAGDWAMMVTVGRNREITKKLEKTRDIVLRMET